MHIKELVAYLGHFVPPLISSNSAPFLLWHCALPFVGLLLLKLITNQQIKRAKAKKMAKKFSMFIHLPFEPNSL